VSRAVRSDSSVSRGPAERALAWLYTGPLGHLYGVVADVVMLWARYAASRLRKRYWPGGV
jgi:hypothetical protein